MFDLILKNGNIADGTGKKVYKADIGIKADRIAAIGQLSGGPEIDVSGMLVTPGFIDTHSHADCSAFLYPNMESYLRQGITTFVGGQCGDSSSPSAKFWTRKYWEYDMWQDVEPFVYNPRTLLPVEMVSRGVEKHTGHKVGWPTFREYHDLILSQGIGCNMMALAGHSQIRAEVMGFDQNRQPTPEEIGKMKELITEAMDSGCRGFSTGRDYPPSANADLNELDQLISHTKDLGGYYFTHWRRTGPRFGTPKRPNKLEGITEGLDIAERLGIKTVISHLATGFEIYPPSAEMDAAAAKATVDHIERYIKRGVDVAWDVIPGLSGGICITPRLAARFVPWIRQSGGIDGFIRNLGAADYRRYVAERIRGGEWYPLNPKVNSSWAEQLVFLGGKYDGSTVADAAGGRDQVDFVLEHLREEPDAIVRLDGKSHEEIRGLLDSEHAFVCTDTYAFDLRGLYGNGPEYPELLPHPHTYCAFPKYIKKYPQSTIEATIRKITGAPAEFLEIDGRGHITEGAFADICVINMEKLDPKENYADSRVYPEGIDYVFVNGKMAVSPNGITGEKTGRLV